MNPLPMVNSKVSFRASVLHRIIARAEKRLQEQPEEPVWAKSEDKAGTSSDGGQSSELQAVLKVEFATQPAEFAASIAVLTTRLNKIERTGERESKNASPKRKRKSATTDKASTVEEVTMDN
uniref:Uncharacterized protein n=1 Tax=Romanomermis culicivorax TaxID=13658 RepID=A0A915INB5_ROMCU